jgi:transposase
MFFHACWSSETPPENHFSYSLSATVRKEFLREWLGTLPSMRKPYQTDLSDTEWSYVEPHVPTPKAPGRPRLHTPREILEAIFYIVRSGCAWRLLPHDFPPWKTVHRYFRTWRIGGAWERIHTALRRRLRVRKKRDPEPSAGVVDITAYPANECFPSYSSRRRLASLRRRLRVRDRQARTSSIGLHIGIPPSPRSSGDRAEDNSGAV